MKKVLKNSKGFTLMEVVVVLGILALLAAIMTPIVLDYLQDAKKGKAQAETNSIYAALLKYNKDNNKWPGTKGTHLFLYSDGSIPLDSAGKVGGYDPTKGLAFSADPPKLYPDYVETNPKDPWGSAYVVLINALLDASSGERALILSAGPDGVLQTGRLDTKTQGDDIGRRMQ